MAIFLLVLLLALYAFYLGVQDYKGMHSESMDFKEVETDIFNHLINWVDYSDKGTGVFFIPAPTVVVFSIPPKLVDLTARVNSIASLHIIENRKGESVINRGLKRIMRFSNIVLYLGTLLALLIGFTPFRNKQLLKQFSGKTSPWTVYTAILTAGFSVLISGLLIIFGCILILGVFIGFHLPAQDIAGLQVYMLVTLLMLLFFMLSGSLIALIRAKTTAFLVFASVWAIFVYLTPLVVDTIGNGRSGGIISANKLFGKKLAVVKAFEDKCKKEILAYKGDEEPIRQELAEKYWRNDFNEVEALEKDFLAEIAKGIKRNKTLSMPFITTFYQSACDEISSNGYKSYLNFYNYLIKMQRDFTRFWIDKVHVERLQEPVNFIQAQENLYFAKSGLPNNFWAGFLFHAVVVIILFFISYYGFKRPLFAGQEKGRSCAGIELDFDKGKIVSLQCDHADLYERIINVFYGKSESFDGKISINGSNIVNSQKKSFMYLFNQEHLPDDLQVGDYLAFNKKILDLNLDEYIMLKEAVGNDILDKRFGQLTKGRRAKVLMSIAELGKWETCILYDFFKDLPRNDLNEIGDRITALRGEEVSIVILALLSPVFVDCDRNYLIGLKEGKYDLINKY